MVVLVLASGSARAQTTSNGPYYATPAWDQKLDCTSLATCPRFIVLLNWNSEAVLDRETGLVWERSPDTTPAARRTWKQAQDDCNFRTVGNRKGWRLATVQELASLVDPSQPFLSPALPPGHPFILERAPAAWSATTDSNTSSNAWAVGFIGTAGPAIITKDDSRTVWCVRGGQGVDPQ